VAAAAAAAVAAPAVACIDLVAMAVGVLMHRYSLQRGPALARLQKLADDERRGLADQAGRLVEAVELLARGQG
jgi:response regulator NasT